MEPTDPPILNYANPAEPDDACLWRAMRGWRAVAGWALVITPFAVGLYPALAWAAAAGLFVATALSLSYMTRAAEREVGAGYAVRHLVLAILMLPVVFVGLFLVTRLVEADVVRWRLPDEKLPPSPHQAAGDGGEFD